MGKHVGRTAHSKGNKGLIENTLKMCVMYENNMYDVSVAQFAWMTHLSKYKCLSFEAQQILSEACDNGRVLERVLDFSLGILDQKLCGKAEQWSSWYRKRSVL